MDSSDRLHAPDEVIGKNEVMGKIAQHLRHHPYAIRHVRKLMRIFHASAADMEQAINRTAIPLTLQIDPEDTGDKVLLHLLRHPEDLVDVRLIMRQLSASEKDMQRAFAKLEMYIVGGGEEMVNASIDKK